MGQAQGEAGRGEGRTGENEEKVGEKRRIEEDEGNCKAKRGVDSKGREGRDPGAARHGNFINYYEFHPPEERVGLLPPGLGEAVAPR